jgi:hypothetical protein
MASILKIGTNGGRRFAARHPPITQTFDKKAHAQTWARKIEEDMQAGSFADERRLADISIATLIEQYQVEIEKRKSIGRSKRERFAF